MKYDYTALINQPRHGLHWDELVAEGWCEWMKIPYWKGWCEWMRIPYWTRPHRCGPGPNYIYIMRKLKDEPRMWTEAELRRFMRETLTPPKWMGEDARRAFVTCQEKELVKSILEDAQTEADMQTAYRKELQQRNVELQAAINEVVREVRAICRPSSEPYWGVNARDLTEVINKYLYPLETKKEELCSKT